MNYKVVITESAYQDIDYILVFIVARQGVRLLRDPFLTDGLRSSTNKVNSSWCILSIIHWSLNDFFITCVLQLFCKWLRVSNDCQKPRCIEHHYLRCDKQFLVLPFHLANGFFENDRIAHPQA